MYFVLIIFDFGEQIMYHFVTDVRDFIKRVIEEC